jgi:hypothetical protein
MEWSLMLQVGDRVRVRGLIARGMTGAIIGETRGGRSVRAWPSAVHAGVASG